MVRVFLIFCGFVAFLNIIFHLLEGDVHGSNTHINTLWIVGVLFYLLRDDK